MRHHKVLAKNFLLSTVTMLMLALGSSQLRAQFSTPTPPYIAPPVVPTVFDGLDWLTDRGGFLFDGMPLSATAYGNFNVYPQRLGRNNVGPYATPTPALDAHRGINNWNFPRSVDTNGPGFTCIVDNPYFNNNVMAPGVGVWNKSFPGIFSDSSQPIDALTDWLGKGFTIPPVANRATNGFSFTFSPVDPPTAINPPSDAIGDYGYNLAVHNDFVVNRGNNPSGPATAAELAAMPNVDPAVYKAVQNVLIGEYNSRLNILGNPIAQWTLGTKLNYNYDVTSNTQYPGFGAVIDPLNPNQPPTEYISPVPYDGYPLLAPSPATAPNLRTVKYNVDIYSPGSGTILPDTFVHPNVQRAFVRVSWKKTVFQPGLVPPPPDNINPGTPDGMGGYVAGAGGVNDPTNSRIYMVDLSQPGWIHIGAPNATPASFPNGGGVDQIVVTLYSVTPDDPNDSTLYSKTALVTADACRFTETIAPALPVVGAPVPPANNLGPLNDPLNPNITFVGANGRFLGPVAGTNKFTQDGSTLWYCVREEVIPNQVRVATDPTLPINTTTNLSIIDPASTSTAPVFYCLANERDLIPATVANPVAVETTTKSKVVWRYVGFPDGGSATSFTSPVVANVRGRDGKYHVIVYFCSSSDTELNGQVGRIYALDALGDTRTDPLVRTTVTTAYWTYPSLRPIEKEEIPAPTGIEAGTNTFPNQYHDPNFTHGFAPGLSPPADPENLYSINDPGHYNNAWVQGYWWNADQPLFTTGSKQYYDGDIIASTDPTKLGSYTVKSDTQIIMGGIVGAPVVLNDPGNPTGPMLLVVPSIDGRMYAFDAGGRGDFNTTKTLPAPAVDPTNPTLPPGTVSTLGVNYTIPGTTQRIWAWPHWGADAFHQIYDLAGSITNASTPNTFQDEASKGAMPFSPSYDSTFGQDDPRNVLVVSAGSNGQDGLPGTGHVYGIIPLHDGPVSIGTNNIPTWNVIVTGGLFTGTTDRRYWAYPHEGNGVNDPSDTPLLDIPGVPTIYPAAAGNARNIYFTSGGRVYSLNMPNALPNGGHYDTTINWVFPHTPVNYLPNQDPNDTTTAAFPQGFAPKGLCVVPAAVSHVPDPTSGQPVDAVYALLTDGTMISLEAYPIGALAFRTIQMGQSATPGTFTEAAPTLVELAVGVALGGSGQLNNGTITLPTSVPALVYADDNGDIYGIQLQPNTYTSGANSTTLMPVIYHQSFGGGAPITTPPALAASTRILPVNTLPPLDPNGHVLNAQPYYGGYFVVGDSYGQLHAFALGTFANGYGGSSPNEPITDNSTGSGAGRVSIDIREFDVFSANDYNNMAPLTAGLAAAKTPARKQDGTTYPTTATPLAANIGPAGNRYGIGVDQGGNLYLAASGVYHAQAENSGAVAEFGVNAPIITVTFRVSQIGMADEVYMVTATPLTLNPNNTGTGVNDRWPDDLAIPAANKDLLQIWGIDNNNPSATPNPFGDGSAPQQLTGRPQNVYPWVAKQLVRIIPKNVNGTTTFSPGSGTSVTVTAVIVQNIRTVSSNRTNVARASAQPATLGYQNAAGSSQSMLGPDPNNPYNSTTSQKELFVTNPLGLTVRSYQNLNDMTGTGPLVNPNMVGWAGPIDSPFLVGSGVANVNELVGNGAFVGLNIPLRAAQAGNIRTLNGYIKPVFAPFGLASDNSSVNYMASNGGTRIPAIFVMDRSNLTAATGQPVKVRASVSPLSWNGTVASILNPLPFDQLPDPSRASVDYPALNSANTSVSVNGIDATKTVATLKAPTNTTTDPSKRQPQPTPINLSAQIAKYFPANVNRGQVPYNYRGTTINIGGTFVDMAGYEHGYSTAIGSAKHGSTDTNPIVGPLDTASGLPINQVNGNNLAAASPSGGYVGNVTITVVPPGTTTTRTPTTGIQNFFRPSASGPTYRIFQTGLSVAPSFRMRVLETTLDMGKVPHGTGYTDLVGGNYLYRYPFAPTATGAYNSVNAGGTTLYSPWDSDGQFNLSPLAATVPPLGRYFLPFTLINDGNVNMVRPRVTKLFGPHGGDPGKTPNLSDVINNASLSINPGFGIANSLRLNSDQVSSLLSPPLFAAPFGQQAPNGANPGFLGNIGIVSSFDHDSYAQGLISEVNLYPLANPAVDGGTNLSNPTALQNLTDLYNAGLYAPDLYAKGANVAATKWGVGVQGRPSIHKPRPGDSNGVIATIPDQPHDYQFAVQNNNSGTPNYYASQQNLGLFSRPAMSIAVPLGTPVGTYSATVYPYEDGLPLQWLEWLATSDPKNSGTQALGNDDDILNTNSAGQPAEPFANPSPTLRLTVQENRLTNGNTTGSMPQIDMRNGNTGVYDPLSYNLQPAALMIPDTSVNLRNSIWLYWTTNRVFANSKFGTNLNGSTFPNPNAPLNIAYSSLNTPYANLNGYIRGDSGFTGTPNTAGGILLPQWWGSIDKNNNQVPFALLPGYADKDTPDMATVLFGNNGINISTARYASPAVTLATRFDRTTGTYPVDPEAYEVHQGSVELLRQGSNSTPLAFQQTLTRTFYSSLNGQTPGAPDYAAAGAVDGMFAFDNDPALPKLSPHPLLVKIQTGAANVGAKFLYVFWHSGTQGRSALYYNVNVQTKGLNQGFDATTPAAGNTPGTGFALLGDAKLDTPAALSWQSDPYPVYRHVFDPITNQLVDAIDVMYTGVLKNRQTVEILISRYRIVETAQPANGSQPALQVGQLTPIPFPTVHQDLLSRIPGTNTWAARDAAWFLPPDSQNADTAANRYMQISLMPANNNNSYPINALENNLGTQRGKVDPATGQVYFNAVAIDKATNKIAVDAANRPIFGGGQIVVDSKAGTVSFPNIPPKNTDTVLASYTPYLIRVNTARDDFNIDRDTSDLPGAPSAYGNGQFTSLLAKFRPNVAASGQNYAPTYVMDRAPNSRVTLQSPQVIYNMNNVPYVKLDKNGQTNIVGPPIDRKWILYRKSDVDNKIKTVYMKTQRLLARLPRPVALSAVNGTNTSPLAAQVISNLTVQRFDPASNSFVPLRNVYEVDWVRGRVYFQEEDEGDIVQISYTYYDPVFNKTGQSGNLYYRVDWGDEINSTFSPYDTNGKWIGYDSTQEVQMPSNSTVNEGAVTAFKDSYIDKLWVFWSSTRAGAPINGQTVGTTDLYYETLAPQFYPTASNQY